MKTMEPAPLRAVLDLVLASLAALGSSLAVGVLLAPFNPLHGTPDPAFFRLFVGESVILSGALLFLIRHSPIKGGKLLGYTLVLYVGVAQVLQHIEILAFNFMFSFGPAELGYLVGSEFLTALVLVPLIITIAGKWQPGEMPEDRTQGFPTLPAGSFAWRLAVASLVWFVFYFGAGYLIADPITHSYYLAKNPHLDDMMAWLFPVQLGRGLLWTLLFLLGVRVLNRPVTEAGLLLGVLFGVFHAGGLLLPSAFMPNEMRLSHLPEIVVSLVLQGTFVVGLFAWRPASR